MKKILILLVSVSLIVGCRNEQKETKASADESPIKVKVAKAEASHQQQILKYSGIIEASQTIPLTFQTAGIIGKIYVGEGDFVKKGQLLAEVEKGSLVSAYDGALAKYNQATDAQARLKKVYDNGSLPEIKWVEVNSQVAQAASLLDATKRNLENCELRAPDNGVIGERNIEPGMSAIQINAPLKLVKIEKVLAKISVPENEISLIQKGQGAGLCVSALNRKTYQGLVERVGVVANQLSRTYEVKIAVDNKDLMLKPGMVCEVEVSLPASQSVILIPLSCVIRDENQKPWVYVVDPVSNLCHKNSIALNGILNDKLVVSSGLSAGEIVVVQGNQKISDSMKVTF